MMQRREARRDCRASREISLLEKNAEVDLNQR